MNLKTKSLNIPNTRVTNGKTESATPTRTVSSKGVSPHGLKLNMATQLVEQRTNEEKESFVRTVLTARQKCETFNTQVRQNEQHALTSRDNADSIEKDQQQQAEGETAAQLNAGR